MQLSETTLDRMARTVFMRLLAQRLRGAGMELPPSGLPPGVQESLWLEACNAAKWGLHSTGAALVVAHMTVELGLGCIDKLASFRAVVSDGQLDEAEKARRLWLLRSLLLVSLEAQPASAFEALGATLQTAVSAATPLARQRAAGVVQSGPGGVEPAVAVRAAALAASVPGSLECAGEAGLQAYLRQPLLQAHTVLAQA